MSSNLNHFWDGLTLQKKKEYITYIGVTVYILYNSCIYVSKMIIKKVVNPETTIHSDQWKAYYNIEDT